MGKYPKYLERGMGFNPEHKNGNGLDNRKKNLRPATIGENNRNTKTYSNNTSGCKGVSWYDKLKKWTAYLNVDNNRIHLGYFRSKKDAIKVRKEAEESYHEGFSYDNSRGDVL